MTSETQRRLRQLALLAFVSGLVLWLAVDRITVNSLTREKIQQARAESWVQAFEKVERAACVVLVEATEAEHGHRLVIRGWSKGAESLFGYTAIEARNQDAVLLLIPEDMRPAHDAGLDLAISTGKFQSQTIFCNALRKGGGHVKVMAITTRVPSTTDTTGASRGLRLVSIFYPLDGMSVIDAGEVLK